MDNITIAALSVSGLCLAYNFSLGAFRSSTFEVFNSLDTIGRTATILLTNLSIYALGKYDSGAAQVGKQQTTKYPLIFAVQSKVLF